MAECFFSVPASNSRLLCVGPITRHQAEAIENESLGDGFGYYLYLADVNNVGGEVEILAKMASEEAVVRLGKALSARGDALEADC